MGIFLFPSPSSWGSFKDQMVWTIQHLSLRQRWADIRDFTCHFLAVVNTLDKYEDNCDIKEVFNSCLDEPLSSLEMGRLGTLTFLEFVYQIYHHGGPDFSLALLSSVVPEIPGLMVLEDLKLPGLPVLAMEAVLVSPAMAKRAVFIFHIMAVLRAWAAHTSLLASSEPRLVCHPQPAPSLEATPKQPAPGPETVPEQHAPCQEAVPELPALPVMATEATEATLSCYAFALLCVWATHTSLLSSSAPAPDSAPDS